MEFGISSLADQQTDHLGRRTTTEQRITQIIDLGVHADRVGLDVFGVGEHHDGDFAVSSPAVVLAAIAQQTATISLTSAVTVLSVLDPVRVQQDFATLDLISGGRAEITAGRSAFAEPFALFGASLDDYAALFDEKLELLRRLGREDRVTWSGRFRTELQNARVIPRPAHGPIPIWLGVGGSPESVVRAGTLGLPMIISFIGGSTERIRMMVDLYREAGAAAGREDGLRVGLGVHFYAAASEAEVDEIYPYYRGYLAPKQPGDHGLTISRAQFDAARQPGQAVMIGTSEQLIERFAELQSAVGVDRFVGLADWGALPNQTVLDSVTRLGTEIAPAVRRA